MDNTGGMRPVNHGGYCMDNTDITIESTAISIELKRQHIEECLEQLEIIAVQYEDALLENAE